MKILSIQFALFTKNLISRPDLVLSGINEKLGNILDAMPTILNLPPDIPADIPLAQGSSLNGVFALNVARTRIDFIVKPEFKENIAPADVFKKYRPLFEKYYKTVLVMTEVQRVGLVLSLFEQNENNVKAIYDRHLQEKYSMKCIEASVRTNKQNMSKGTVYNNLTSIEASELTVGSEKYKGVHIQLDINNVPAQEKTISSEEIAYVISQSASSLKTSNLKELI